MSSAAPSTSCSPTYLCWRPRWFLTFIQVPITIHCSQLSLAPVSPSPRHPFTVSGIPLRAGSSSPARSAVDYPGSLTLLTPPRTSTTSPLDWGAAHLSSPGLRSTHPPGSPLQTLVDPSLH